MSQREVGGEFVTCPQIFIRDEFLKRLVCHFIADLEGFLGLMKSQKPVVRDSTPRSPYLIHLDFNIHLQVEAIFDTIPSVLFYHIHGLYGEPDHPISCEIFVRRATSLERDAAKALSGWNQLNLCPPAFREEKPTGGNN